MPETGVDDDGEGAAAEGVTDGVLEIDPGRAMNGV